MPKISTKKFNALMAREMPWAVAVGMTADAIGRGTATVRLPFDDSMLRPGGTVSGPTMMVLALRPWRICSVWRVKSKDHRGPGPCRGPVAGHK